MMVIIVKKNGELQEMSPAVAGSNPTLDTTTDLWTLLFYF